MRNVKKQETKEKDEQKYQVYYTTQENQLPIIQNRTTSKKIIVIIFPLTQVNLRCNNNTSTSKLSWQLNYTTFNQHTYNRESITNE